MPEIALGTIFTHIGSADEGIEWVVGLKHLDNSDIFYIVPLDMNSFIGTWDIESRCGSIRCSHGEWIGTKVFEYWLKTDRIQISGQVEEGIIFQIALRMAAMVGAGECEYKEEVDLDPDYQEHMEIVAKKSIIMEESVIEAYKFIAKESGIEVPVEWFRYKW